jgi:hypothetical protein
LGHSKASDNGAHYSNETIIKKSELFINNLIIHLKLLEKQEQAKPKSNRQKEI